MRAVVPFALIGGEQADGGDVGRQIERVGGERALQRLAPVGGEGEHALGGVAVEFDIDVGEPDGAAHHVGLRLDREMAEAAAGQRLLSGPDQRVAQRGGVGGERAFDLERGLDADGAFERRLDRRCRRCAASSRCGCRRARPGNRRASWLMSSGSSCQTKRPVAPKLLEIDGQASENSTSVSVSSSFCDGLCTTTVPSSMRISENAATRRRVRGLAARQRLDQAGPVGFAVRLQVDRDGRPLQRHVGDLDPADAAAGRSAGARSAARR